MGADKKITDHEYLVTCATPFVYFAPAPVVKKPCYEKDSALCETTKLCKITKDNPWKNDCVAATEMASPHVVGEIYLKESKETCFLKPADTLNVADVPKPASMTKFPEKFCKKKRVKIVQIRKIVQI